MIILYLLVKNSRAYNATHYYYSTFCNKSPFLTGVWAPAFLRFMASASLLIQML